MSIFPLKVPKRPASFPLKIQKNTFDIPASVVAIKADGTCIATEAETNEAIKEWKNIVNIKGTSYNWRNVVGLKTDGTLIARYDQFLGVSSISNIVDICLPRWNLLLAVKADGMCIAIGTDTLVSRLNAEFATNKWKNIVSIAKSDSGSYYVGLKADGTCVQMYLISDITVYIPEVAKWKNIVKISCESRGIIAIKADGTCIRASVNVWADGTHSYDESTLSWTNIVNVAINHGCIIGLRADGRCLIEWTNTAIQNSMNAGAITGASELVDIKLRDYLFIGLKADGTCVSNDNSVNNKIKTWNVALPLADKSSLITSKNAINLLDKSKVKGFTINGIQPANTNRKVAFKVDNKWNKLTTEGVLSPLPTQAITSDSVLAEGNTVSELTALTNVPSFVGKMVYPAFALYASNEATAMPTIGMTVKAEIDTTVDIYTKTAYSQEFVLHNERDVLVKSISVDSNTKGNGKVTLKARYATFNETALAEKWSGYVDLLSVINKKCHKLQIKADYQVSITDGSDSATLNDVIITYAREVVAKTDGGADLVTLTEKFTNDLTYVHAYIKHKELIDADLKAYVRLQKTLKKADFKLIGYGTGARKTYKVTDSGINQDSLMVYVNGKAVYDFDFNTETSEITLVADVDVPINASYEYGWELFNYVEMQKGVSQINDSGAYTTEYSYIIPTHEGELTVTAIKYELIRPEGHIDNEIIGIGTGKRQIIQLPHFARKETIQCNGKWSYDYDSKRLTVIAPKGDNIVISYDWIAESPVVYGVMAGWAD